MFFLTEAGRANLMAILDEFQRASRYYPPLYHQRLIPWSGAGEVSINESQWEAFVDAESASLDDEQWWQWDGPHRATASFHSLFLGMWLGSPDGMQEFYELVDSTLIVLCGEDFSESDDFEVPSSFRSFSGWMSTIHSWAFRHQMPLLRCDMTLWGAEDHDSNDFDALAEQLGRGNDISYPIHPLCWALIDNVFTSSMTAIRAILEPHNVIATNELWPVSSSFDMHDARSVPTKTSATGGQDETDGAAKECHKLIQTVAGPWQIRPANSENSILSKHQSGLHRIAAMIESSPKEWHARDLATYGSRRARSTGQIVRRSSMSVEEDAANWQTPSFPEDKDDEIGRKAIGESLLELVAEKKDAVSCNDEGRLADIEDQIREFKKFYHIDGDGKIRKQRPFRDPQHKKAHDTVSRTIRESLSDIGKQSQELEDELTTQLHIDCLAFRPEPDLTPWKVEWTSDRLTR